MTILAYLHIISFMLFFGGLWANAKSENDRYGFLFLMLVVMGTTGLLMALSLLGLLPEVSWD